MSMSFNAAFASIPVGATVQVSNGLPEPGVQGGRPWQIWRSHNFTGELVEKIDLAPRRMVFTLPPADNATVSYTVTEGLGHAFTEV